MVFELLQGKAFRSIGWSTLFDCLSIYDQKFKQSFQGSSASLPEIQEGDARALVAYLDVLQKVFHPLLLGHHSYCFLINTFIILVEHCVFMKATSWFFYIFVACLGT